MKILVVGCVVLAWLAPAHPTWACTCISAAPSEGFEPPLTAWPFDDVIRASKVVIVGTVTDAVVRRDIAFGGVKEELPPAYLEVEVIRIIKGRGVPQHVRIWDPEYGSSCEGVLTRIKSGADIVIVLDTPGPSDREMEKLVGYEIPSGEYITPGGCRSSWKLLETDADRKHYIGKHER